MLQPELEAMAAGPPLIFHLNNWQPSYIKDMMEQSTQTNNYERPKKKVGRPKGTGLFTDEQNKERARMISRLCYSLNIEKERDRKRLEYQAT